MQNKIMLLLLFLLFALSLSNCKKNVNVISPDSSELVELNAVQNEGDIFPDEEEYIDYEESKPNYAKEAEDAPQLMVDSEPEDNWDDESYDGGEEISKTAEEDSSYSNDLFKTSEPIKKSSYTKPSLAKIEKIKKPLIAKKFDKTQKSETIKREILNNNEAVEVYNDSANELADTEYQEEKTSEDEFVAENEEAFIDEGRGQELSLENLEPTSEEEAGIAAIDEVEVFHDDGLPENVEENNLAQNQNQEIISQNETEGFNELNRNERESKKAGSGVNMFLWISLVLIIICVIGSAIFIFIKKRKQFNDIGLSNEDSILDFEEREKNVEAFEEIDETNEYMADEDTNIVNSGDLDQDENIPLVSEMPDDLPSVETDSSDQILEETAESINEEFSPIEEENGDDYINDMKDEDESEMELGGSDEVLNNEEGSDDLSVDNFAPEFSLIEDEDEEIGQIDEINEKEIEEEEAISENVPYEEDTEENTEEMVDLDDENLPEENFGENENEEKTKKIKVFGNNEPSNELAEAEEIFSEEGLEAFEREKEISNEKSEEEINESDNLDIPNEVSQVLALNAEDENKLQINTNQIEENAAGFDEMKEVEALFSEEEFESNNINEHDFDSKDDGIEIESIGEKEISNEEDDSNIDQIDQEIDEIDKQLNEMDSSEAISEEDFLSDIRTIDESVVCEELEVGGDIIIDEQRDDYHENEVDTRSINIAAEDQTEIIGKFQDNNYTNSQKIAEAVLTNNVTGDYNKYTDQIKNQDQVKIETLKEEYEDELVANLGKGAVTQTISSKENLNIDDYENDDQGINIDNANTHPEKELVANLGEGEATGRVDSENETSGGLSYHKQHEILISKKEEENFLIDDSVALKKSDIADFISQKYSLPKNTSLQVVNEVFETMTHGLKTEGDLRFRELFHMTVKKNKKRKGRNPKTGEEIDIPSKKVVTFKMGKELFELVNK